MLAIGIIGGVVVVFGFIAMLLSGDPVGFVLGALRDFVLAAMVTGGIVAFIAWWQDNWDFLLGEGGAFALVLALGAGVGLGGRGADRRRSYLIDVDGEDKVTRVREVRRDDWEP